MIIITCVDGTTLRKRDRQRVLVRGSWVSSLVAAMDVASGDMVLCGDGDWRQVRSTSQEPLCDHQEPATSIPTSAAEHS